jgi:hypothetical protein
MAALTLGDADMLWTRRYGTARTGMGVCQSSHDRTRELLNISPCSFWCLDSCL